MFKYEIDLQTNATVKSMPVKNTQKNVWFKTNTFNRNLRRPSTRHLQTTSGPQTISWETLL